jgi:hypothetical protein
MNSKIYLFLFILPLLISKNLYSQDYNPQLDKKAYQKGDFIFNMGMSPGVIRQSPYSMSNPDRMGSVFPLVIGAEYGFQEFLSTGPYLGFYSRGYKWTYLGGTYSSFSRYISTGAKVSFHMLSLLNREFGSNISEDQLDIYVASHFGVEIESFEENDEIRGQYTTNYLRIVVGPVFGARILITERFGVFLEIGRGALGYSNMGVTFRL